MLENWMILNLLVSPGDGPHPYGESFAMMFLGAILIGLLLSLLILVIAEPLLFIIRKKGERVFLISGFFNSVSLLITFIFLVFFDKIIIIKLLFMLVISMIQLLKIWLVKQFNDSALKISIICTFIIEITYIIIILVLN